MNKKQLLIGLVGMIAIISFSAFEFFQDQKKGEKWDIPEKYQKMENPYKNDKSLVNVGKTLYMKHCRSCHGNKGMGDGPKAKLLKTFPGEFSNPDFQKQTDGAIYYQAIIGRDDMPSYESKITEKEDRWALINYIRTMK